MEGLDGDLPMDGEDYTMVEAPDTNGFLDPRVLGGSGHSGSGGSSSQGDEGSSESASQESPIVADLKRRGLLPTGLYYDDRMKLHANADFGPHAAHPEDPQRIDEIMKTFKKAGLVFLGSSVELVDILKNCPTKYMWRIPSREATKEEITTVHLPEHYDWVKALSRKTTQELRDLTKELDQGRESVYVGSMSYEAALISAGGAIETCRHVVNGDIRNGFAVIRPPGHHAEYDQAMGFCLFNNVPIAARVCQGEFPETCRKILILDWDVHHGNGVQNMFYEDPNVLYISLHVYANGTFYPGKADNPQATDGGIEHCGSGPGLGRNVNIGWHEQGMGDGEYMAAFQQIVMPIATEFNPDLVIVSAGFDAADGDELGGCFVSPACYAHMTHMLMSLAAGRVAVCLEGGYNLHALSMSALAVARTLMGEPPPQMDIPPINKEAARVLAQVRAYQAPFWECMRPGIIDVRDLISMGGRRLHDVVRTAQAHVMAQKYKMLPMYIQRETLFRSYENQVLVTPGLLTARKVLVVIHDPPELVGQPDPLTNALEAHNSWVTDGVLSYVDWAVNNGFGVMDINIPRYVTRPQDTESFTPAMKEQKLQEQIQELICYIWDNYLQLMDQTDSIFLMGIGFAYIGIKSLLLNRDCKDRISGVVCFVDGILRQVKSDVDTDLSSWYKEHSRIYVANNHACWTDADLARKVLKRRFGTAIRSPAFGLARMLAHHAEEVHGWIRERVAVDEEMAGHGETTEEEQGGA